MTSTSNTEGTEDVNDFLLRIRELGEKRDKEDEERTKKLEEEILKGRRERQARRAGIVASLVCARPRDAVPEADLASSLGINVERARSISPTKDSPLSDPARFSMPPATSSQRVIDPPEQLEPTCYAPEPEEGRG
ncbi:hypothetical protein EYZ11_010821 [Aspergillus tanneri]|uniref:DUF4045 domain-containing protein n=1 Tax=Aspergillus tanneri TaxID=1220188 RepID=A0A4S3J9T7_9EURO|nr:hypothetical protein EYZ11_010821 [Aspergillus tanneri]